METGMETGMEIWDRDLGWSLYPNWDRDSLKWKLGWRVSIPGKRSVIETGIPDWDPSLWDRDSFPVWRFGSETGMSSLGWRLGWRS